MPGTGAGSKIPGMTVSAADSARRLDLPDQSATEALAARLAREARPPEIYALGGPLGAGKTTFARAFVRACGAPDMEVPSPTFTLVQTYDTPVGPLFHFDLFRIRTPEEAFELGIEDAFAEAISLIEWPERLGDLLPRDRLDVALDYVDRPHARLARLTPRGAMADTMVRCGLA